ncbi:Retrovirus-related Pol poly from transposon [Solea senegalensis]|uniref:Gypsy retrotransposon integrase-like protein 1 n=1 Tax=Solea senegalensis TaxID=28829 RepID=A0AAV6PWZ5_SOLSE|nr:Retrovirus-related Pol poly from transposon [Solea senegalensis]
MELQTFSSLHLRQRVHYGDGSQATQAHLEQPKVQAARPHRTMGTRLQLYNLKVEYRKGSDNPADYMSRHPVPAHAPTKNTCATKVAEAYVNFIIQNKTPKAMTLDETLKDETLQKHRVLKLAHEAHQGITKTKALLREKVWFPNIDRQAEAMVRNCLACQANTPETHNEPLQMSDLPDTVWQDVSADFYGPLPTGEHLRVIVDEYSRYPVVEVIHSTSANSVIPVMDKILSMLGIPRTVKTDNGPPFTGEQFSKFAVYMGFHHRKSTPLWPQAKTTAERFMRTLGKCLRVAHMANIPWKQHLHTFLREYRATPHSTTTSPAELLKCRIHTKMPSVSTPLGPDEDLRRRDRKAKAKMKTYTDTRRHT